MSEQADIEAALARATAAYKNVSAERDALKDANDRAEVAEAERDRLREALRIVPGRVTEEDRQWAIDEIANAVGEIGEEAKRENDRLREALTAILDKLDSEEHLDKINNKHSQGWIAWWQDLYDKGRAALAKEAGQ
jgi:hypothetical protein